MWKNETTCTGPLKRTDSRMFIRFIISKERNYIVGCGSIVESKIIYMDYHVMGGCRFFFWFGVFFLLLLWVVTGLGFVPVVIIAIIIVLQCDVLCPFFYTFRKILLTTVM